MILQLKVKNILLDLKKENGAMKVKIARDLRYLF